METLGTLIKKVRKEKGLTLEQTSKLSDISRSYLSQIESNKKNPSAVYLRRLSDILDIPYSVLTKHTKNLNFIEQYNLEQISKEQHDNLISQIIPIDMNHLAELEAANDLKNLLNTDNKEKIYSPSFNGHILTKEESERALAMLHLLFPQYSKPAE